MRSKSHYVLEALEPRLLLSGDGISGLPLVGGGESDTLHVLEQQTIVENVFEPAEHSVEDLLAKSSPLTENSFFDTFANAPDLQLDAVVQPEAEPKGGTDLVHEASELPSSTLGDNFGIHEPQRVSQATPAPADNDSVTSFSEELVETLRAANGPPETIVNQTVSLDSNSSLALVRLPYFSHFKASTLQNYAGLDDVDPVFSKISSLSGSPDLSHDSIKLHPDETLVIDELKLSSDGRLSGSGTVAGNVINGGIIQPGNSPGVINIVGNLTIAAGGATTITDGFSGNSGGTLLLEIAGKGGAGAIKGHDQVHVTGNVALAGTVTISLLGGFDPQVGDTFVVLTYDGGISGAFADATGLFGFGDGSRYFALVQEAGAVKLVVRQFPGPDFSFKADTTQGANALGRFLNSSYFTTTQTVTVTGGLALATNVSARGTFTFDKTTVSGVDLSTGFGKPVSQFSDSVLSPELKAQLAALGITSDGAYINDVSMAAFNISTTGAQGFIGETGFSLTSGFGSQSRTGFLLENLNLGVVIMTPTWSVSSDVPSMSFAAAKATSSVKAIGFGGLMSFTAQSASLKLNMGTRFAD